MRQIFRGTDEWRDAYIILYWQLCVSNKNLQNHTALWSRDRSYHSHFRHFSVTQPCHNFWNQWNSPAKLPLQTTKVWGPACPSQACRHLLVFHIEATDVWRQSKLGRLIKQLWYRFGIMMNIIVHCINFSAATIASCRLFSPSQYQRPCIACFTAPTWRHWLRTLSSHLISGDTRSTVVSSNCRNSIDEFHDCERYVGLLIMDHIPSNKLIVQESHAVAGKPRDAAVNSDRYRVRWHFAGAISVSRMQSVSGCTLYA